MLRLASGGRFFFFYHFQNASAECIFFLPSRKQRRKSLHIRPHGQRPFLRGIVAELGYKRKEIPYEQPKRRAGKTHNNFYKLYDAAMLSVTSYTKAGLRLATIFGSICALISMCVALVYLVMKLIWWDRFPAGMAPMLIGMLFLGSVQLFFIGFLGEYIMSINQRVMKRPLVIEEERINMGDKPAGKAQNGGRAQNGGKAQNGGNAEKDGKEE